MTGRLASVDAPRRATLVFAALGAGILASYALLWTGPLWLGDFDAFKSEALAIGPILGLDAAGVVRYVAAFLIPMALYVPALLLVTHVQSRAAWRVAIAGAVGAPLLLLYTYPALAADVFDYLMSGRILSAHSANPYTLAAASFPEDPYYLPVGWKDLPSVYGPLWLLTMGAITKLCGSSAVAALLAAKGLAVIAHWGVAGVVYATTRKLAPERALFAFVAYAWNPLVVVHTAVDGHNDPVLLLFLMLALYLALDRRWELSLPMLTLSVLVKFVPAVLFPLFIWHARRDRLALAAGLAASAVITLVLFAPVWAGSATFDGVRDQASRMTSSPASMAGFFVPDSWLRPAALILFAAGYFAVLRRQRTLVEGAFSVLLLYLLVLSFWTKPWYFIWPIAVGAVLGGSAFWVSVPGVLGLFASNIFGSWGWLMNWFHWQTRWGMKFIEACLTATVLGGWLVGLAAAAAARWRPGEAIGPAPRSTAPGAPSGP